MRAFTSAHASRMPQMPFPTANTATNACPSGLSGCVCTTQASTDESRFNTSISQKAGLRGWNRRDSCTPLRAYATHLRALRQSCIHGLSSLLSSEVQLICTLRKTRSGCGIMAVKRPSAVVTAVKPPGLPLGLNG